jgi:signal transduction histidine kinase
VACVLAGTGAFLYSRLDADLNRSLDQGLRSRAQDLGATVGRPGVSLARADRAGLVEHGESYVQLIGPDGRVLDATRSLHARSTLSPAELARARQGTLLLDRGPVPGLDEPSRLLATPLERDGRRLVLVVGATLGDRAEALASLRNWLLIGGPIALLLVSLAGYLVAGAALRPVESMRRRAASISAERPGDRLPVPPASDEVRRLGDTLNEMLGRLEDALARERRLVADAGHELRTPLTLLKTELELALRHGGSVEELEGSIRSASQEAERLSRLAEDLLLLAQADQGQLGPEPGATDVDAACATVAARFAQRAELEGRPLLTEVPAGLAVRGDRLQLEQALGNMVDNALRHGAGPVVLSAVEADERVELHVRDGGHGLSPAFLPRAFERFSRADEARGRGGAGLGLAIVQTVARASGGTAHIANHAGGGADVWLSLPRSFEGADRVRGFARGEARGPESAP